MSPEHFKYFRIGPDGPAYSWPPKDDTVDSASPADSLENVVLVFRSTLSNNRRGFETELNRSNSSPRADSKRIFFKQKHNNEESRSERERIPTPDDRYRAFLRTIDDKIKYVGMLASLYGFNSPTRDYSVVPHFSDSENQNAFDWQEHERKFKPPRNANEWLRLNAQYIYDFCTPRPIIALSKLTLTNHDMSEGKSQKELRKESQDIANLINNLSKRCDQEMKIRLQQYINFAELHELTLILATEVLRDWRDWIDPQFIGLYREPAQPQIPAVLETPDEEPDSE